MSTLPHAHRSRRHRHRGRRLSVMLWLLTAICWSTCVFIALAVATPEPAGGWLEPADLRRADHELSELLSLAAGGGFGSPGTHSLVLTDRHLAAWLNSALDWADGPPLASVAVRPGEIIATIRVGLIGRLETNISLRLRLSILGETAFCAIGPTKLGRLPVPLAMLRLAARDAVSVGTGNLGGGWTRHNGQLGYAQAAPPEGETGPLQITDVWVREGWIEVVLREVRSRL